MEKLIKALNTIAEEDPTDPSSNNRPLSSKRLIHGQGQLQLDLVKYRVEKVNGISHGI